MDWAAACVSRGTSARHDRDLSTAELLPYAGTSHRVSTSWSRSCLNESDWDLDAKRPHANSSFGRWVVPDAAPATRKAIVVSLVLGGPAQTQRLCREPLPGMRMRFRRASSRIYSTWFGHMGLRDRKLWRRGPLCASRFMPERSPRDMCSPQPRFT